MASNPAFAPYCFGVKDVVPPPPAGNQIVVVTESEKIIKLPVSQAQFFPGKCCIPMWLAQKMAAGKKVEEYFQ